MTTRTRRYIFRQPVKRNRVRALGRSLLDNSAFWLCQFISARVRGSVGLLEYIIIPSDYTDTGVHTYCNAYFINKYMRDTRVVDL